MTLNAKTKDMTLNVILNKDSRRPIEMIGRWPIDMGAVPTQTEHKLRGIWPINMGAAPKRKLELKK